MTGAERVRAELEILGLDASRHVVDFYAPFLDALGVTRARDLLAPAQPGRAAGRRGQGGHPDPADPVRAPGGLPDPRRRAPARSTRRSSRTPRAPTPPRCSTPGCWSCAASCAAPGRAGCLAAGHRLLGAARRCTTPGTPRRHRRGARGDGRRPRAGSARSARAGAAAPGPAGEPVATRPVMAPPQPSASAAEAPSRRRRPARPAPPAAWAGAGCWCTPAGSGSRPTPTSSRPASEDRASPGGDAPAVAPQPGERGDERAAQAVARQPGQLGPG